MRQLIKTASQAGEILRGRRKALHTPQETVAARLGISQGRLSALEGNPSSMTLDRLILLADLLGLELVLQDKSDSKTKSNKAEW